MWFLTLSLIWNQWPDCKSGQAETTSVPLSQLPLPSPCSQMPPRIPGRYAVAQQQTQLLLGDPLLITGNSTPEWLYSSAPQGLISLKVDHLFPPLTIRYSALKSAHCSLFSSQTVHHLSGLFLFIATDSSVKIRQPFNLTLAMITISGVKEQLPGSPSCREVKGSQGKKQSYTKLSFKPIQVHDASLRKLHNLMIISRRIFHKSLWQRWVFLINNISLPKKKKERREKKIQLFHFK